MRRLAIALIGIAALAGILATDASSQPAAATDTEITLGTVDVLQVSGLIDEIIVAEIRAAIGRAVADGAQALILQIDSPGAVVGRDTMAALLDEIATAPVATAVWVGPSTASLLGLSAQILAVADVTGMAPGARVGAIDRPLELRAGTVDFGAATTLLRDQAFGLSDARELGIFKQRISDEGIATIANMVDALDGFDNDGTILDTTTETITDEGAVQRDTIAIVRFTKPGLVDQLFHTVASPAVTYLLLLTGLALLIFEFFTAGVGIAGGVGAVSLILASYGLVALPTNFWAVGVLVAAALAFAIDVQVGIPRFWTGVGIVLTIAGSWFLFQPLPGTSLRPSWITLIAGIGGMMLMFIVGMPSMVRTRFATPTIGRDWMIGATATVTERVDPDGLVEIDAAVWPARTNRATPVDRGDEVRVVGIDGFTLEVEPLIGAARDYREMRSGRRSGTRDDLADTAEPSPGVHDT